MVDKDTERMGKPMSMTDDLYHGARMGDSLEERVSRLEDIESIKNVKAMYARYCDRGYDVDGLLSLFVDDGVWESNIFGTFRGRDAIRGYFADLAESGISWAFHCIVSPIITLDARRRTAVGSWYLLDLATFDSLGNAAEKDSVIVTANYEDTFMKSDGIWKFKHVKAHFHQVSNLDTGWAKEPFRGGVPGAPSER